jgi:hypothetical protein
MHMLTLRSATYQLHLLLMSGTSLLYLLGAALLLQTRDSLKSQATVGYHRLISSLMAQLKEAPANHCMCRASWILLSEPAVTLLHAASCIQHSSLTSNPATLQGEHGELE